ncbi:DNA/RNA non-specific endonuclease [Mucilaginibacter antarcticus]|uniref:DNA/RNA non-specific endonuclease n=1 Tax=Mucilaginibacter antarcticus TaxID=1855725 RepID=A0ABW5XHW8_9SPHI
MKPKLLQLLAILIFLSSCQQQSVPHDNQRVDSVINMGNYKSYYSYTLKDPLYVTYTLKQGGGDCERDNFDFKPDSTLTATSDDYRRSGYDRGHLANAEDFAYSCSLDKQTFSYYNCIPQTRKLNRGVWKVWESRIRELSQSHTLYITAGAIYTNRTLKAGHPVGVPDYCYKVVIDSATHMMVYSLIFPNDNSQQAWPIDTASLSNTVGYPLAIAGSGVR